MMRDPIKKTVTFKENFIKNKVLGRFLPFFAIGLMVFNLACTANSQKDQNRNIINSDIFSGDGTPPQEVDPKEVSDPVFTPEEEACQNSGPVEMNVNMDGRVIPISNLSSLDFGLNQSGEAKCFTLNYSPPCARVVTEITQSSAKTGISQDGEEIETVSEFEVIDRGNSGQLDICYLRVFDPSNLTHRRLNGGEGGIKLHVGQLNIVAQGSFATVVNLRGQTLPPIFNVDRPLDHTLIWQGSGFEYVDHSAPNTDLYNQYIDRPYFKHYKVPVSGFMNADALHLLKSDQIKVSVKGGGITSFTNLDRSSLRFGHGVNEQTFMAEIPVGPAFQNTIFEVEVGVETIHGFMTVRRSLIPYTQPVFSLDAANQAGLVISKSSALQIKAPTDTKQITAGIKIDNAHLSAPNRESPACVKIRLKKGNNDYEDIPEFISGFRGAVNNCDAGFVPLYLSHYPEQSKDTCSGNLLSSGQNGVSFCVTIGDIKNRFSQGVNTFEATVCSEYTRRVRLNNQACLISRSSIIVNNSKPDIHFDNFTKNGEPLRDARYIDINEDDIIEVRGQILNSQLYDAEGNCALSFKVNSSLASTTPDIDLCEGGLGSFRYLNVVVGNQARSRLSGYYDANGDEADYGVIKFNIPLSFDDDILKLKQGKNLVRVTATNGRGHTTIGVYDFNVGKINPVARSGSVALGTAQVDTSLGFDPDGEGTQQAPLQFKFSKQTFDDDHPFVKVITKFMNENLPFSQMVVGGGLRVDDDGNRLPVIAPQNNGEIKRYSTGSMPELFKAWRHYRDDHRDPDGRPMGFPLLDGECSIARNFGCDVMGKQLTTAIIEPHMWAYFRDQPVSRQEFARTAGRFHEWPDFCLDDVNDELTADPECRKFPTIEGKWSVDDLEITNDGYINMTLNLTGRTDLTYQREDLNLRGNYPRMPALMAPYLSYGVIEGGSFDLLRQEGLVNIFEIEQEAGNDFLSSILDEVLEGLDLPLAEGPVPLIANIGSMQIRFRNMIRLMRVETFPVTGRIKSCGDEPCECQANSQSCTNYLYVDSERIYEDDQLLTINPYRDCHRLIPELLGNSRIERIGLGRNQGIYPDDNLLPYGCKDPNDNDTYGHIRDDYPLNIDVTSRIGSDLWTNIGSNTTQFLDILNVVFDRTVRMKIAAMAKQLHLPEGHQLSINSLIDPKGTPYQSWFPERDRVDELDFSLVYNNGGENIEVKQTENIEDEDQVLVSIKPDIPNTEISTVDDITVKIPFSMGTRQVVSNNSYGFVYQGSDEEISLPAVDRTEPSVSGAIGIVQIANGIFRELLSKDIHPLLNDLLDLSLSGPPGEAIGPTQLAIDTVTLGRLGICGSLLEIIDTRLPPSTLFNNVSNYFENDLAQFKLRLDPVSPPVISISEPDHTLYGPVEEDRNEISGTDVTLNIGLSNMRLDVHNLEEVNGKFRPLDRVLSIGVNMLLKVDLKFVDNEIWIYIHPNKSQVIYFDVKDGAGSFHDPEVLENLWEQAVKVVVPQLSTEGVTTPSLKIRIPHKASQFSHLEFIEAGDEDYFDNRPENPNGLIVESYLNNLAPNGECVEGEEPLYFNEIRAEVNPEVDDGPRAPNPYEDHSREEITELDLDGLVDVCKFEAYDDENSLAEDFLCDLGINEIMIHPQISFDTQTGSILFSSDLMIELIRGLDEYLDPEN